MSQIQMNKNYTFYFKGFPVVFKKIPRIYLVNFKTDKNSNS